MFDFNSPFVALSQSDWTLSPLPIWKMDDPACSGQQTGKWEKKALSVCFCLSLCSLSLSLSLSVSLCIPFPLSFFLYFLLCRSLTLQKKLESL